MEEITVQYDREGVRFDDVAIIHCRPIPGDPVDGLRLNEFEGVTAKAECEPGELVAGLQYRFYGRWNDHPKYGPQFQARTFVLVEPHQRNGIVAYLRQIDGIGPRIADRLADKFAGQAVRILRETPDVAATVEGLSVKKANAAAEQLQRLKATEGIQIDLIDLFAGRGFPRNLSKKCLKEFGNRAAWLIRRNPYLLLRFPRTGFPRCDQLYLDGGGNPASLKRQALAAWHRIATDRDGHTWHSPAAAVDGIAERVAGVAVRPLDALKLAKRAKLLSVRRDADGGTWIAHSPKAANEQRIADRTNAWLESPANWPGVSSLDVSDHQREKLHEALQSPIAIFSGGPGTGKTYSAARLIDKILRRCGEGEVAVAAPTGKAAVRISEVMAEHGLRIAARTIHSLLGVEGHSEGDGWTFKHCQFNPLPFRFVVVDEASMIDADLGAALFDACGRSTHLLLIGDTGQLPPVGHGAPLRDLIAAGVPTGELTEIRRNSGQVVESCHAIRNGKTFAVNDDLVPDEGKNLFLLPGVSGKASVRRIVQAIQRLANRKVVDPIWECQVIVAVNAKSDLSRREVNQVLQRELNPGGKKVPLNPFRIGDKIVNLRNGFVPIVDDAPPKYNQAAVDGKVFVANGEQAAVVDVEQKLTVAMLDAPPRYVKIPRGTGTKTDDDAAAADDDATGTGCSWDLAYAITVHKSQGSEWSVVFVPGDEYAGARRVQSREWIYTAMSRKGRLFTGRQKINFRLHDSTPGDFAPQNLFTGIDQ